MLVNTFDGSDSRIGRSLAAALRARIARTQSKRELLIVGNDEVLDLVEGSGISLDKAMSASTLRTVARSLRADEMLFGTVNKVANGFVAEGRLVLVRDERLVQPLPRAAGSSVDGVAATLAESVRKSRLQLVPHRRCENSVRDGALPAAIAHARAALAATPDGVIARSCLLTAMVLSGAPAAELLREAELSLATSPSDYHALDAAARAEDALGNRAKSADYWLRVAATDTADLSLQTAVLNALMRGENAARARPLAERLSELNPDDMTLLKLRWQVLFALREWPSAVEIGRRL